MADHEQAERIAAIERHMAQASHGWADDQIRWLLAQLAEAQDKAERFSRPWLCDCHTWPDPDEAHSYIVALEARLAERERALTEAHSLLWLLGLETHPGEEPQSREDSHRNLDKVLDAATHSDDGEKK